MIACLPMDEGNTSKLFETIAKKLPSISLFVLVLAGIVFWSFSKLPPGLPQWFYMMTYLFSLLMIFAYAGFAIVIEYRRSSE